MKCTKAMQQVKNETKGIERSVQSIIERCKSLDSIKEVDIYKVVITEREEKGDEMCPKFWDISLKLVVPAESTWKEYDQLTNRVFSVLHGEMNNDKLNQSWLVTYDNYEIEIDIDIEEEEEEK